MHMVVDPIPSNAQFNHVGTAAACDYGEIPDRAPAIPTQQQTPPVHPVANCAYRTRPGTRASSQAATGEGEEADCE